MDRVGGFNLLYCQLADFDLWIRIVTEYPIHVLPEKLIRFRWDIKKHDQVSSVTEGHTIRTFNEQLMIRRQLIERLDDGRLVDYFHSDFQNPDSKTHLELEFERAFLLMKCVAEDSEFKLLGLDKIEELDNKRHDASEEPDQVPIAVSGHWDSTRVPRTVLQLVKTFYCLVEGG